MIRFYLVEVEGKHLGIADGPAGFIASRWVLARSPAAAAQQARDLTLRNWARSIGGRPPTLEVLDVRPVGFLHALRFWRMNNGHSFYAEE